MRHLLLPLLGLLSLPCLAHAQGPTRAATEFFEKKIRPDLVEQCYRCHSAQAKKTRGGLRLDTRDDLLRGGDNGPAVVPGQPAKSLLLKALRHEGEIKKPPTGRLAETVIADFARWIEAGAADPRTAVAAQHAK
jgi:hypothetical protein